MSKHYTVMCVRSYNVITNPREMKPIHRIKQLGKNVKFKKITVHWKQHLHASHVCKNTYHKQLSMKTFGINSSVFFRLTHSLTHLIYLLDKRLRKYFC